MDQERNSSGFYMDPDGKHPNAKGLQRMKKRWIKVYPPLGSVAMKFGNEKYPYGNLLDHMQVQAVE